MTYLLDTNTCITYFRKPNSRVRRELAARTPADIRLCSVVMSELYRGALRSADPVGTRATVDAFAAPYTSLPFDDAAADTHSQIRVYLERLGQLIGPYDLMIGAIARTHDFTLVTHNTNEFTRVPGLVLEDWEV